ncbi:acyl-CoA dehydrogenase/oxidase [Phyllosticta citriasiana]|uniref:Acyl-CoA dehydrogenase/oxidase n=1 Tax=Phyllosticta citriasiana TaxID=595635 RepID=A0ABR1KL25_9PEZI
MAQPPSPPPSSSPSPSPPTPPTPAADLPPHLPIFLHDLDTFISSTITPLQNASNNPRFFDHRREPSRTDFTRNGLPNPEWESLLAHAVRLADAAGFWRYSLPSSLGGRDGTNLDMAVIREHLAAKGLGLFNDLQNEHSVVGNFPDVAMVLAFGTEEQREALVGGRLAGKVRVTFGLTEPGHGSDATWMETRAWREAGEDGVEGWRVKGTKMWQTGMHRATHCLVFARTAGENGDKDGISCFIVPADAEGVVVESYEWTLNMPTDHATVSFNVFIPHSSLLGALHAGLLLAQAFVHENRIRQAASSLGAASYCLTRSLQHARHRAPFGAALGTNQAISFPLVRTHAEILALRHLIRATARRMDACGGDWARVEREVGADVAVCNVWANRLVCRAADGAIQIFGARGYSRHEPFEHIWRHHRRYRITEGAEQVLMRKVAGRLLGLGKGKGVGEKGQREELKDEAKVKTVKALL